MTINQIKKRAVKEFNEVLSNGVGKLEEMSNVLKIHFNYTKISEVGAAYEKAIAAKPEALNPSLAPAIDACLDLISSTIDEIQILERFIMLHTPQMEDGNNFGVTVQMMVQKALVDSRNKLTNTVTDLPIYYSSRADAVDQLGLQKVSVSTTKTKSASEATGGKDGDENKTSSSTVTEEKTSGKAELDDKMVFRLKHIASLDVMCYFELKNGLVQCRDMFLMILDTIEKNKSKLSSPKGASGGNSMGMY